NLARFLRGYILRHNAVFYETDNAVLRILVKFPRHVPNFPIYSNGTKPGALQSLVVYKDFRGRSYSRAALAQVAAAMSLRGVRFMSVPLVSTNTHARAIFESVGLQLARKNYRARV
ncbi:GNAT family N-acetyltransferase, partial [Actinobaculum suis]|uniref:GNAT family N-acetyltransferase n=1 Tax=Actinobaculum suis TaxID=1657 RepID=UPI000A987DB0